jgi:hypothetical protein
MTSAFVSNALSILRSQHTGVLAVLVEHLVDLVADFTIGDLDVVLGGAVVGHEREEAVVGNVELREWLAEASRTFPEATYELELATGDIGDVHVVGGGAEFLELLVGEDVDGDEMDLGVAVLASLGGGHLDNLAGTVLDDDVARLPQSRALHRVRRGRASIGAVKGVLMLEIKCQYGRRAMRRHSTRCLGAMGRTR